MLEKYHAACVKALMISTPGPIDATTVARLKAYWDTNFTGDQIESYALFGDGYTWVSISESEARVIREQLTWHGEPIDYEYEE